MTSFSPWLIEINASPAIGPSTTVTAKMVPVLLRDILALTTTFNYAAKRNTVGTLECIFSQDEERKKSAEKR